MASRNDPVDVDTAVLALARRGDRDSRTTGSAQANSLMNADVRHGYLPSGMSGEYVLYRYHALLRRVSVVSG